MTTLTREEGGNDEKHLQLKLMTAGQNTNGHLRQVGVT